MPYVGHLKADRTFGQEVKDLFDTIQQVKQDRRNKEIGQRLMDIIAGGGGQPEIAGELSRKPEGRGGIPGMLDVFNPMTAARTSPLEEALQMEIMRTSMDPLAGLRREKLTADIGLTKTRKKAIEEPEIKPQKMIEVYYPEADASYYEVFDPKVDDYKKTGKMVKKPTAKWGQTQRATPDEVLPAGTLYQVSDTGEIKPVRWPQEVKPQKMIEVPGENGIVWYYEFNPKTGAYEKTDMMAERAGEKFGVTPWYLSPQWIDMPQGKTAQEKALKEQSPEERMKWLQTLLRSAQGPYFGTAEYKEPLNPQLAEWVEKELKKLPMFKGDAGGEVSTKVKMKAPDGKIYEIDSLEVEEAEGHGWTRL